MNSREDGKALTRKVAEVSYWKKNPNSSAEVDATNALRTGHKMGGDNLSQTRSLAERVGWEITSFARK